LVVNDFILVVKTKILTFILPKIFP